jgi:ethanolamine permease
VSGPAGAAKPAELERTLGPVTIWALGVGYVISGMYFGWNLGLSRSSAP